MIAEIAVAAAVYAIDRPYRYVVPAEVCPGMRVQLPFGSGNRMTEGMILRVYEGDETGLKSMERPLDEQPLLSERMLYLAAFLRERYFCTFYDALRAMLPAGLWYAERDRVCLTDPLPQDWAQQIRRKPEARQVVEALLALGGAAQGSTLRSNLPAELPLSDCLRYLAGKKLISQSQELRRRVRDRVQAFVRLEATPAEAQDYAAAHRRTAPMQAEALTVLSKLGSACAKDICYFTGASMTTLRRLEKLGLLSFFSCEVLRPQKPLPAGREELPVLNDRQLAAFEGLSRQMAAADPGVALLYGVTGSGKTAVYGRLIEQCLRDGKQAILLVPEISLTPQLLGKLAAWFGDKVAVLHSSLRVSERCDAWRRVREGRAEVVVGTRSAVFAPAPRLGLLIVDEEHEHTYKSEQTPYYHAREAAIYRGVKEHALVLLGSATPSVESMYRAKTGVYSLYTLTERYNGAALPQVVICDMKREIAAGNGGAISRELLERMQCEHAAGRKTILFLNRRGSSPLAVCVACGFVPRCPRCSVRLTYHAANRRRMCHYCGYSEHADDRCPVCGGRLKFVGFGTQRVEQELVQRAPELHTLRMDADTVSAANSHEKILSQFESEDYPVLLGTQMVTKGLNFEAVTLVGVLDADAALYLDHFRASETAFSMMTQVIGRAGRFQTPGTAVIQTMTPENEVILQAARQDYDSFYEKELPLRRLRGCPPFCDLITITLSGRQEARVIASAAALHDAFVQALCQTHSVRILDPAPAPVTKVNNTYRYRLTLCAENSRPLRALVAGLLRQFPKDRRNAGVYAAADINAYD